MAERIRVLVIAPILIGTIAGILSRTVLDLQHGFVWASVLIFCMLELWVQFMFVPFWNQRQRSRDS